MDVKALVAQMTLEEKAAILTGAESMLTTGVPRLGIDGKNLADGPHGVRSYVPGTNCTTLPSMCAIGATWSKEAAELAGKTMGLDCIHHNKQMILGPGLNIKRNALNGRNFEYVSEDPVLTGEIAGYVTKGIEDLGIGTSMKHFALNSQETYRTEISVDIDERTMREIYLRAFELPIVNADAKCVMTAFNRLGAVWAGSYRELLTDWLRGEAGMSGFAVTDMYDTGYMVKVHEVLAGNDIPDNLVGEDIKEFASYENTPVVVNRLRESSKRVLYTVLHSRGMDGIDSNSEVVQVTTWWQMILNVTQWTTLVLGAIFGALLMMDIIKEKGLCKCAKCCKKAQ